jgi:hypothetical protein
MSSLLPVGHKSMTDFFISDIQETDSKGVLSVNDNCGISRSCWNFAISSQSYEVMCAFSPLFVFSLQIFLPF